VAHGFQSALSGSRFYQASGFAGGYDLEAKRDWGFAGDYVYPVVALNSPLEIMKPLPT